MQELQDLQTQKEQENTEAAENLAEITAISQELLDEILNSIEDTDEILEPKKRIWSKKMFTAFDTNKNNAICKDEFAKLIFLIDADVGPDDIDTMFTVHCRLRCHCRV